MTSYLLCNHSAPLPKILVDYFGLIAEESSIRVATPGNDEHIMMKIRAGQESYVVVILDWSAKKDLFVEMTY